MRQRRGDGVGHDAAGQPMGDVWSYELATGHWRALTRVAPRYDAGLVARGDELFVGGGMGAGGVALGDLLRIRGESGSTQSYGNALPMGAAPFLGFDEHGDGLVYGGGYVGAMWYRDVWHVTLLENAASTSFVADFSGHGMPASEQYALVADVHHGYYWALPGYTGSTSVLGTWLLARGVVEHIKPGTAGTMLRAASGGGGGADAAETSEAEWRRIARTARAPTASNSRVPTTRSPARSAPARSERAQTVTTLGRSRVVP